jgi:anti-anti-sigma factor
MTATMRSALERLEDYEESPPGLHLTVSLGRHAGVVIARGNLDSSTASTLVEAVDRLLAEPRVDRLVIDLTELRFVDLAGLRQVDAIGRNHAQEAAVCVLPGHALTRISKLVSGPPT